MKVLLVGHLTQDLQGDAQKVHASWRWGGSVFYCAQVYASMGFDVHVVTSVGQGVPSVLGWLNEAVHWHIQQGRQTTRFVNRYDQQGQRIQQIDAVGKALLPASSGVPAEVDVLHLCPVFDEVSLWPWLNAIRAEHVALGIQGWLRASRDGVVIAKPWPVGRGDVDALGGRVQSVFMSHEDLRHQPDLADVLRDHVPLVVTTHGVDGGVAYDEGRSVRFCAVDVPAARDPTGAGDVFSAACVATRVCGGTVEDAVAAGAAAASLVVEGAGLVGLLGWRRSFRQRIRV